MKPPLPATVGPLEVSSEREARRVSRCPECGATLVVHRFRRDHWKVWANDGRSMPARFVSLPDGSYGKSSRGGRGATRLSDLRNAAGNLGLPLLGPLPALPRSALTLRSEGIADVALPAVIHCPTATCGGRRVLVDVVRANG